MYGQHQRFSFQPPLHPGHLPVRGHGAEHGGPLPRLSTGGGGSRGGHGQGYDAGGALRPGPRGRLRPAAVRRPAVGRRVRRDRHDLLHHHGGAAGRRQRHDQEPPGALPGGLHRHHQRAGWRGCIWHMSEPSQSPGPGHHDQLLDLSLGLLGRTPGRRSDGSWIGQTCPWRQKDTGHPEIRP